MHSDATLKKFGFDSQADLDAHLKLVEDRQAEIWGEEAKAALYARVAAVKVDNAGVAQAARSAQTATNKASAVHWVRKAADLWMEGVAPISACKPGCSQCCHIPVTLNRFEAEVIAAQIGVKLASPKLPKLLIPTVEGLQADKAKFTDYIKGFNAVPCTFLKNNECSIYENRPVICRGHMSLDSDALLCKLTPDGVDGVPYADSTKLTDALMSAGARSIKDIECADIRDWFPVQQKGKASP